MTDTHEVVSLAAIINASETRCKAIEKAADTVDSWDNVISQAERDGIAPMLYRYLKNTTGLDSAVDRLRGLAIRHRHATKIRMSEFFRISETLADNGIASAALKGVALAGLIYPEPGLRPMRDIDFLVSPSDADAARHSLESLGYEFEETHLSRFMRRHHHLPNASKIVDGLKVSVEIHTRAISRDAPRSITMASLHDPLQLVDTPFGQYHTLGHLDMLHQLCRHALEPGHYIRLMSVMDIQGYCERFIEDIDWQRVAEHYPFITNFLSLSDLVVTLPESLSHFSYQGPAIDDPGRLVPTVSIALGHSASRLEGLKSLFNPPEWWLKSYYRITPEGQGRLAAFMHHKWRVTIWLGRRLVATLPGAA
ncbi:MAG: hypothetical protein DHS20C01_15190 [marine bacterium B5-7]|nr:MAG: hypothetical protein DHS20C01_15190 [marine bacterium B5-7]